MYESTLIEPIYDHSDLGSALVAVKFGCKE